MNEILAKQLAIDFCTDVNSILSKENVFTEYKQQRVAESSKKENVILRLRL